MKHNYTIHIDVEDKAIRVFASSSSYDIINDKEVAGPTDCKEMNTTYPSMLVQFVLNIVGEIMLKHFPQNPRQGG